jgi:capsule polysaccharide modification protein KpsS
MGVITLSGTTAFEAAMLNIPSIMFGNTFFENIEGITKLENIQTLPTAISNFKESRNDNKAAVALYIKAIEYFGEKIRIIWIINESSRLVNEDKVITKELQSEIKKLVKIFGLG